MEMETILDGLADSIKEKIGQCISTKELWLKLKHLYLDEGLQITTIFVEGSVQDSFNPE